MSCKLFEIRRLIFHVGDPIIRKVNGILVKFGSCDPFVLTNPLTCFCMSYYGCVLWSLDSCAIKNLDVCISNCLRHIIIVLYQGIVTLASFTQVL